MHIPTLDIKLLLIYLLELNAIFRLTSLSVDFDKILEKSSPFRFGKLHKPNYSNALSQINYIPVEVTYLQKFMFSIYNFECFCITYKQASVIDF
jgi:hypothetical protein